MGDCDYDAKGYPTRGEASRMAGLLGLQPGCRLLDVGAGAGGTDIRNVTFWATTATNDPSSCSNAVGILSGSET